MSKKNSPFGLIADGAYHSAPLLPPETMKMMLAAWDPLGFISSDLNPEEFYDDEAKSISEKYAPMRKHDPRVLGSIVFNVFDKSYNVVQDEEGNTSRVHPPIFKKSIEECVLWARKLIKDLTDAQKRLRRSQKAQQTSLTTASPIAPSRR